MFRMHLTPVTDKCMSLSQLDTIHYFCGSSFSLVDVTLAGSVVMSVPSLVTIGIYIRLGKSMVCFPWNSRIWLNGKFICIPEQNMTCFFLVSVILKEKTACV